MLQSPPKEQQIQGDTLADRFKAALLISKMDKESKKKNMVEGNQKADVHEVEVNYDGKKSKAFVLKDPEHNALNNEITMQQSTREGLLHQQSEIMAEQHLIEAKLEESKLQKLEGMLQKKSPHFVQGWQQRYCMLDNKILKYYIPEQRDKPFGILNFDIVTYKIEEIKDEQGNVQEFIIRPVQSQKVFQFKAYQQKDTAEWARILKLHLEVSNGVTKQLVGLCQYVRYWRTDRITEKSFAEQATTGDILLFRGHSANCQMQRAFTRSEYDHVAMLLKFNQGTTYMFEATGYYGVGIMPWNFDR